MKVHCVSQSNFYHLCIPSHSNCNQPLLRAQLSYLPHLTKCLHSDDGGSAAAFLWDFFTLGNSELQLTNGCPTINVTVTQEKMIQLLKKNRNIKAKELTSHHDSSGYSMKNFACCIFKLLAAGVWCAVTSLRS